MRPLRKNELDYISLFFAVQRLGAILVPINYRFTKFEVSHICKDSGAKLVVAEKQFVPLIEGADVWNSRT